MRANLRKTECDEFDAVVSSFDLPPVVIRAILTVESSMRYFDNTGRVVRRFEPHVYSDNRAAWRRSLGYNKAQREKAFQAAVAEDKPAAYEATSWGAGQIMGFNARALGYESAQHMVNRFTSDPCDQVRAVCRFIIQNGAASAARAHDFDALALVYNGSGQPNVYARKLRLAVERESGDGGKVVLSSGSRGARVRQVQRALGVVVDGYFGPETRSAVRGFQIAHGLTVDGVVGRETWAKLSKQRQLGGVQATKLQDNVAAQVQDKVGMVSGITSALGGVSAVAPSWALNVLWGAALLVGAVLVVRWVSDRCIR